ncbi:MAG TPA: beta-N-acetylhexosaminidase [Trebonia sp.]|nr:beta-N-acetylhexosaminidase [Trebonia sp.]
MIIPRPVRAHVSPGDRKVALEADGFVIAADDESRPSANLLRAALEASTGWDIAVVPITPEVRPNAVTLTVGSTGLSGAGLPDDGYRLRAAPDEGVVIAGGGPAGVFYGVQTLRLLLPPDTLRNAPAAGTPAVLELPAVEIEDAPRYAWRGVHLDVARHFFPKSWILRLIDLAALHKFNVLHLHLTDDQGWRFPVQQYPLLTEVGSWRKESPVGLAREKRFDGTPHGGFYSLADLAEIVAFAARRHITVVPEIDMPGHMQAAIAAYPELGNRDARKDRKKPLKVRTRWGISEHVLNVDDATVEFCANVLDEVMDVFPGPYVHLGGDECPAREWHDSDRARQRMRQLGYRAEGQLQGWFMSQVAGRLKDRGRRMVGWDEVIDADGPEDAVIMAWRKDGYMGRWAAELGHQVVMAPEYYVYLDWAHSDDESEPLAIRGATSVRDVYTFDPVPRGLSANARENIIGAQAQLWTEYVPDTDKAEYMYFPRLCAFAEVVWSSPGGEYAEFEDRLSRHVPRLDACDVRYRPLGASARASLRPADAAGPPTGRSRPRAVPAAGAAARVRAPG